ncbi:MAG: dTDP-4-dehydrorhamnose reductase [Solirubrobacteraceae bacterium]
MRILITGAGGMLGQDVHEAALGAGHEPVSLTRSELDITDAGAVGVAVEAAAVDVVVNCAAWTDVDGAESAMAAAEAVNARGAEHLAGAAAESGAWTIHVSTDYVFDGHKESAYVESDTVNPLSVYGATKLQGELAVARAAAGAHTIVRSSWLFGAGGKCFPKTILRVGAQRDRLDVVRDQVGSPTFTGHLAAALVSLAQAQIPGVVHVAGGGQCSWFEFARAVVAAGGLDCEVAPIASDQYPQAATRPRNSVLISERGAPVLPAWNQGLSAFMSALSEVPA